MDNNRPTNPSGKSNFEKPYWLFMVVFAISAVVIAYLMVRVYESSRLLAESSRRSFAQEVKTQAANLDGYFERLRGDLQSLAKSRAIQAYYQNRALGMSLEYGLSVAVAEVHDEFEHVEKNLNARGRPVVNKIILLDSKDMSEITQTRSSDPIKSPALDYISRAVQGANSFPVFTVVNGENCCQVFVITRVIYKSEVRGFLMMRLNLETIRSQLETDDSSKIGEFYLVANYDGFIFVGPQEYIRHNIHEIFGISPSWLGDSKVSEIKGKSHGPARRNLIVSGDNIAGSPFYVLRFAASHKYLAGYSTELWIMVFTALFSSLIIMMLFIYRSWLEQSRTYAELQEARDTLETRVVERTSELAQTNQLLENEIRARSGVEESLRLSEAKYRDLFEHASDLIFTMDFKGRFNSVNGVVKSVLGYTPQEFIQLNLHSMIDIQAVTVADEKFFSSPVEHSDYQAPFEILVRSKSDASVWLEVTSRLIFQDDAPVGFHCIARDVTERKELESAVQEAQMKYRSVIGAFEGLIHISSPDYTIQFANARLIDRTGYNPVGNKCYQVVHGLSEPCSWCSFQKVSAKDIHRDQLLSPRDGRWYDIVSSPMAHQDGSISRIFLMHDIDHQKRAERDRERLEQSLVQAQKMEAVGTLAGGIAHDFNNLLQVVLGYSELTLRESRLSPKENGNLEKIHKAAQQGAELVKNLLAFGRKAPTDLNPVNINLQIEELFDLLERTIPKMIRIKLQLEETLPIIEADAGQIKQALMNLALNARDAMPDGGILTIETQRVTIGPDFCCNHVDAKPGDYVMLIVSDTGHGMDRETLQHMFEPFYTTKEVGKGTGLGLSMVFGMVKQHGGFITFDSQLNRGAEFRIFLPAIDQARQSLPVDHQVGESEMIVGGTILLVDDEEMVRELGADFLSHVGYRMFTASNCEEALELYKSHQNDISLVLLDLIMPEMGGKSCLMELLKIDPDVKVIIVSGYSPNEIHDNALKSDAKAFVSKPYDLDNLIRTIDRVLNET